MTNDGSRSSPNSEPRNPFYFLLLLAGLVFVLTVLALAVVPELEKRAIAAGEIPPPSAWRKALREDGWRWVLYEVAAMVVLGIASMGLDRYRRLQKDRACATIASPAAAGSPAVAESFDPATKPHAVARSPDLATEATEGLPSPRDRGDLRSDG